MNGDEARLDTLKPPHPLKAEVRSVGRLKNPGETWQRRPRASRHESDGTPEPCDDAPLYP